MDGIYFAGLYEISSGWIGVCGSLIVNFVPKVLIRLLFIEFGIGIVTPSLETGKLDLNTSSFFGSLSRNEDFCIAISVTAVSELTWLATELYRR